MLANNKKGGFGSPFSISAFNKVPLDYTSQDVYLQGCSWVGCVFVFGVMKARALEVELDMWKSRVKKSSAQCCTED